MTDHERIPDHPTPMGTGPGIFSEGVTITHHPDDTWSIVDTATGHYFTNVQATFNHGKYDPDTGFTPHVLLEGVAIGVRVRMMLSPVEYRMNPDAQAPNDPTAADPTSDQVNLANLGKAT